MDKLTELLVKETDSDDIAYRDGQQRMDDASFDRKEGITSKISKGARKKNKVVANEPSPDRKVRLTYPMFSLNKIKTVEKILSDWMSKHSPHTKYVVMGKYNGISTLKDGDVWSTRGDGEYGMDISHHLTHINTLDRVNGELIFSKETWNSKYRDKTVNGERYSLPLGTVGGILKDDKYNNLSRDIDFVPYGVPDSTKLKHEILDGFSTPYMLFTREGFKTSEKVLKDFWLALNEKYECDGLVVEIDDPEVCRNIGRDSEGNPRYAIAYKHPSFYGEYDTTVTSIRRQISKNGVAVPVVEFDTVNINGANVSNVNGINQRYITDWYIAKGERITVMKSGDVIPKIVKVGDTEIPFKEMFTNTKLYEAAYSEMLNIRAKECSGYIFEGTYGLECPECGTHLTYDSLNLICPNMYCRGRLISVFTHFFGAMGITDAGEGLASALYDGGFRTISEIIRADKDTLKSIKGIGEGTFRNVWGQLSQFMLDNQGSKGIPFARLAYASNLFEGLGETTIQNITNAFNIQTYNQLFDITNESLIAIDGVGEKTATAFIGGVMELYHSGLCSVLRISSFSNVKSMVDGILTGQSFCFSGYRDAALKAKIESLGGEVTEDYKKSTTVLVVKDLSKETSKMVKARKDGKRIVVGQELDKELTK